MRRVVVTGIGVVSPLGNDRDALVEALAAGRSGVAPWAGPGHERLAHPVAAAASFDASRHFDPARTRMLDRVSQLALVAAAQAVADAGAWLEGIERTRAGVFVGTGMGGSQATDDGYRTLYAEKAKVEDGIAALEAFASDSHPGRSAGRRGRKSMGAEERHRVSERMKKYWATWRETAATPAKAGSN